ncbi:MAG: GNAT family N-acetyltransferase [Clostridia bacterium]|nr:GNAT family N-acetyltransferase [Clostridia bacterium]
MKNELHYGTIHLYILEFVGERGFEVAVKTLETERLILRDWTLEDIGCQVYDEKVIRYLISVKNNYAVVLKENGMVIGTIGLNEDADDNPDTRNVGIRMLEQYRNRGLMSEAIECVIHNANNITKTLSYLCMVEDKRSQHIAEKFGFQFVKTFYKVQKAASDEPKDFYYYKLEL